MKTISAFGASAALILTTLLLPAASALAVDVAATADDICAPGADPCTVSQIYDVTGPLDFGARTLLVVPQRRQAITEPRRLDQPGQHDRANRECRH